MSGALRRLLLGFLGLAMLLGGALAVRLALAPKSTSPPEVELEWADEERLRRLVGAARLEPHELIERLRGIDVLLVGEVHFFQETMDYLTWLLDNLDDRPVSLLLELPAGAQGAIDAYLEASRSEILEDVFDRPGILPYGSILAWAATHPERVPVVVAMDENRSRIVLNRTFLRDTRNETMARRVLDERRRNPGHRVVAYGGQLHFMRAGRYLYDVENRVPMGARLERLGIARQQIATVMVSGEGVAPICDLLEAGAVIATSADLGEEPYPYFLRGMIYRADSARELFDYFVDLGPLSHTGS